MVLAPRRVAWATPAEFQLVFSYLFTSEGELQAQRYAIDRIKVWLARGNCPHAVESTASLLEIVLRDTEAVGSSSRPSQQELRLAYSMALIRFVNTLVDPLQTTYFARSIASLAAQLGLPLYFVELRHAATHEDLPSISVLREASRQALDWLYGNYWLPTLSPSTSAVPLLPLDPLRILLRSYKVLAKTNLRDASKALRTKTDLLKVYRGIDGWVVQAESMGRGRDRAVEGLVEAFLEIGGMVPTAKKKRPSARTPDLPHELLAIWTPIITRMDEQYEGFVDSLVSRMVEILSLNSEPEQQAGPTGVVDRSYAQTLTAWILHFLSTSDDPSLTESVIKTSLLSSSPSALALLDVLARSGSALSATVRPLLHVLRNSDSGISTAIADDAAESSLDLMERRMLELEQRLAAPSRPKKVLAAVANGNPEVMENGWKKVRRWKACPIGALPGGKVVGLDLV